MLRTDLVGRLVLAGTTLVGIIGFGWPFLLRSDDDQHSRDAPWLFAALLLLLGAVVAAELARNRLDAKSVAVLGVLASVGGALRVLSAGSATGLELMFFLLVLAGRVLGPGGGFLLGNVTILVSAVLTGGIGPWLPFQMLASGWVAMGAALLPSRLTGRSERIALALYGFIVGLGYGAVMNLWFWPFLRDAGIGYQPGASAATNLSNYATFYAATSLAWDLPRAVVTAVLCLIAGRRVLASLRRGVAPALIDVRSSPHATIGHPRDAR